MKITGYGKGWQEPKAKTPLARVMQRLREPATTTDYISLSVLMVCALATIAVLR